MATAERVPRADARARALFPAVHARRRAEAAARGTTAAAIGRGHLRRRLRGQRADRAADPARGTRIPATFFIATSYLDGGRMWNDTVIEAVRRLAPGDHRFPHAGLDSIEVPQQPGPTRPRAGSCWVQSSTCRRRIARRRPTRSQGLAGAAAAREPDDASRGHAGADRGRYGHRRSHPQSSDPERSQRRARRGGNRGRVSTISHALPAVARRCSPTRTVVAELDYGDREVGLVRASGSTRRW